MFYCWLLLLGIGIAISGLLALPPMYIFRAIGDPSRSQTVETGSQNLQSILRTGKHLQTGSHSRLTCFLLVFIHPMQITSLMNFSTRVKVSTFVLHTKNEPSLVGLSL